MARFADPLFDGSARGEWDPRAGSWARCSSTASSSE
jgi:hypothetical protein